MRGVPSLGDSAKTEERTHVDALASRICLIAMDVIVLSITWYRTFDVITAARRAGINSSLVSVMLRDGMISTAVA